MFFNSDTSWQTKVAVLWEIRNKISTCELQVNRCSSQIVPAVIECLTDTKSEVQEEAKRCLTGENDHHCRREGNSGGSWLLYHVNRTLEPIRLLTRVFLVLGAAALGKELIHSPEMVAMVDHLVQALIDPFNSNTPCVEKLMDVTFMNPIDRPCLSIMVPVLKKALQEKRVEYKRRALLVVGNICGLVINSKGVYNPGLDVRLSLNVRRSSAHSWH